MSNYEWNNIGIRLVFTPSHRQIGFSKTKNIGAEVYCQNCGEEIITDGAGNCPLCGKYLEDDMSQCRDCGKSFPDDELTDYSEYDNESLLLCDGCGNILLKSRRFK